jgi:hypothetical protein
MSGPRGPSVVQSLFDAALEDFERKTWIVLAQHALFKKLETCDSVDSIITALQKQAQGFRQSKGDGGKVMKCLKGLVRVLHSLSTSGVLGEGIGLVRRTFSLEVQCPILTSFCSRSRLRRPYLPA